MAVVRKMVRDLRGSDMTSLTPANEALMFSIYYTSISSMDEDDVSSHWSWELPSHTTWAESY